MSYAPTRRELYRDRHQGGRYADVSCKRSGLMPTNQVASFKQLYKTLLRHYKTKAAVSEAISVSSGALWRLEFDDYLSRDTAQKILDGYKAIIERLRP